MEVRKTKHSVYNLNYHIVFVTKYRHTVLSSDVGEYAKKRIIEICNQYGWNSLALEVMDEHIHLFVSAPPKTAPLNICSTIKSILTVDIFQKFSTLKKQYFWGSGLFSDGSYYGSAGTVSSSTIKKYIEEQKKHD